MEETLIWVAGLIAEILLVSTVVLAVLLWRSRKARQQLLAQLANQQNAPAQQVVVAGIPAETVAEKPTAPSSEIGIPAVEASAVETEKIDALPLDALQAEPSEIEAEPAITTDAALTLEFDQLLVSIDNAGLDESVERLHRRLEASTQSLQRLSSALAQEPPDSEQCVEVASLQVNLHEMTTEVDSLQQSNTQLQQDLRSKTKDLEQTAAQARDHTERVLQHARKLRSDIATLRDKLKNSAGDVQRLQAEKAALATEFDALNKEYARVYANTRK